MDMILQEKYGEYYIVDNLNHVLPKQCIIQIKKEILYVSYLELCQGCQGYYNKDIAEFNLKRMQDYIDKLRLSIKLKIEQINSSIDFVKTGRILIQYFKEI